jgi:hypothetical protein
MRRHPPRFIQLSAEDKTELEGLVRDGRTEQRVVCRARVLLAMEQEQTVVEQLAGQVEMSSPGIWYLCRRYEERGWEAIFDASRSGRPGEISPLGESANRATGWLRAGRSRPGNDPLVEPELGQGGRRERPCSPPRSEEG